MAGRKLVLEIATTGEKEAAANVRDIRAAVDELNASLQATSPLATGFEDAIATASKNARTELEQLIQTLNAVPTTPTSAPTSTPPVDTTPSESPPADVPSPSPPPPSVPPASLPPTNVPPAPSGNEVAEIVNRQAVAFANAKLLETQALVEIQELLNQEAITAEAAQQRQLAARRSRIESELTAERQKSAELQALPSASDPKAEEARQVAICASAQKTADLQLQLAHEVGDAIATSQTQSGAGLGGILQGVTGVAFGFNQALQSIQAFMAGGQQAYALLIGANEELRQQVLGSAATIAATSKVMKGGVEITDPTQAIQALQPKILDNLKQVQKESQELVGVTGQQVSEVYNVVLGRMGSLQGQLKGTLNSAGKEITDPLEAAVPLTKNLTAALGTLRMPLAQANQEIGAILTGNIDVNAQLAKSLGINNEMVRQWRSQGTLVSEINKRLEPFAAGNKLAAQSISGITSNLQDVVEMTAREAGAPLLDAIIKQLQGVYDFVQKNQDAIQEGGKSVVAFFMGLLEPIGSALQQIGAALLPVVQSLGEALGNTVEAGAAAATDSVKLLAEAAVALVKIATPLLQIAADIANVLSSVLNTEMGRLTVSAIALTAGVSQIAGAVQLLAPAALALQGYMASLVPAFIAAGGGVAGLGAAASAALAPMIAFGAAVATALAPFLVLGAAIALTLTIKKTGDIANVNDEIDAIQKRAQAAGDAADQLGNKIRELNAIEKQQGGLTPEQEQARKKLIDQAQAQAESNKKLKDSIAAVKPETDAQKGSLAALGSQLDFTNKILDKSIQGNKQNADALSIGNRGLQEKGDLYKQLEEKAKGAIDVINTTGNQQEAEKAAKDLISTRTEQVQLGKKSTAEAIADLEKIASNTKLSAEVQKAAIDGVTKLRDAEGKKQVDAIASHESEIQKLAADGRIGDAEKEKELTANKASELNQRLENVRAARAAEEEAGRGDGEKAAQLANEEQKITAELAQNAQKQRENAQKERIKDFDERLTQLDAQHAKEKGSEEKYQSDRLAIQLAKIDEEIRQNREKRARLSASDKEGQQASLAEEAKLQQERVKVQEDADEKINQLRVKHFDNELTLLDAQHEREKGSESQYLNDRLGIQLAKLDEEIRQNREKRAKLGADNKEGQEASLAEEAKLQQDRLKAIEEFQAKERELQLKHYDNQLQILEASRAEQQISQEQFLQQRLTVQQGKFDEELRQNAEQRAKLGKNNKEGLEASLAEEAKIRTERAHAINEAEKAILAERMQTLEQELTKSADIAKAAQTARLKVTQELLNAEAISEEEANRRRADSNIAATKEELEASRQRLAAMQQQPALTDTDAEADRQHKIREEAQKTGDLQIKLLEQERARSKEAIADIARIRKEQTDSAIKNYESINQALQQQGKWQDLLTKQLNTQTSLIQSRAALEDARRNLETTGLQNQRTNLERAMEIQKQLGSGQIKDQQVRLTLEQELSRLGVGAASDIVSLTKQRAALGEQIAAKEREQKVSELARTEQLAQIEARRNQLAAEREVREARMAENQAKSRLLQAQSAQAEAQDAANRAAGGLQAAQKTGDVAAIADATRRNALAQAELKRATQATGLAQNDVTLSGENVKAAQESQTAQAEISKNAQEAAGYQKAAALAQLDQADFSRRNADNLAIANAQAEQMAANLERAAAASKQIGTGSATAAGVAGSRRMGGAMEAGAPYWVGEGAGGSILPTSEIIVPRTDSYAIAAHRAQEWLTAAAAIQFKQPSATGSGIQQEQTTDLLYREIGQLRQELHNLRFMNPVQINAEYHNTFAREDEQAFLDRQRRQQIETAQRIFRRAADDFYRG